MQTVILALASAFALSCTWPEEQAEWPPDTSWVAQAESVAVTDTEGAEGAGLWLPALIEAERSRIVLSDVVVLARVERIESYRSERGGVRTAIALEVEECLRGECQGGHVVTCIPGGVIGDEAVVVTGFDAPAVGARYVFCLTRDPHEPGKLRGGHAETRFLVKGDFVKRKGMRLGAFLSVLRRELESRPPERLFMEADAVVAGTVIECTFKYPPLLGHQESAGHHNSALLSVEQVAKGSLTPGQTVLVCLPPKVRQHQDVPSVEPGERVVMFLRRTQQGAWWPLGGKDSALHMNEDGSVGDFPSLEHLADQAAHGLEVRDRSE